MPTAKPEPISVPAVVVQPAPLSASLESQSAPKAEPIVRPAASLATPAIRPSQSDYAARPSSPRPPERIDTLPSVSRPEPAAARADTGLKPMAKPAGASIADAGIKPITAPKAEPVVARAAEPAIKPAAIVKPAPVAKAPAPKVEPAPKPEPKAAPAPKKAEAKPAAANDGEHRCEDCGKTEAETTFPRKGDWISKVCRACRKARGLRP